MHIEKILLLEKVTLKNIWHHFTRAKLTILFFIFYQLFCVHGYVLVLVWLK